MLEIWRVDLDEADWERHAHVLSADEKERAARFALPAPARRFRNGRIALRLLLSQRCGRAPGALQLRNGEFGKPSLVQPPSAPALHFNMTHSAGHALIALAGSPLGIDMESLDHRGIRLDKLADMVCHPDEKSALQDLPARQRAFEFYRLWTRKEAYCKARGTGLQLALPAIRFLREPGRPEERVVDEQDASSWWSREVEAPERCVASVCTLEKPVSVASHLLAP